MPAALPGRETKHIEEDKEDKVTGEVQVEVEVEPEAGGEGEEGGDRRGRSRMQEGDRKVAGKGRRRIMRMRRRRRSGRATATRELCKNGAEDGASARRRCWRGNGTAKRREMRRGRGCSKASLPPLSTTSFALSVILRFATCLHILT